MNNLVEIKRICQKRIIFISDLHFDFVKDATQESGHKYATEHSEKTQTEFINYVKENFANDILLLGGDFYNNTYKTLEFIKEMENNQIFGFFVLGNHDYWNNSILNHKEINSLFADETAKNNYFRLLSTGIKYYVDDLCFIGDTGWTSFQRTVGQFSENEHGRQVMLKQFMSLPDAKNVRDFSPKIIRTFHNEWIKFANQILMQEQKVIIITHFPMIDLTREDIDCWWSSRTQLLKTENQWRIYGHTHSNYGSTYNITSQRGYNNKIIKTDTPELYEEIKLEILERQLRRAKEIIERRKAECKTANEDKYLSLAQDVSENYLKQRVISAINQYTPKDFGILHKASDRCELSVPFQNIINKFYSVELVVEPNENSQLSNSIKRSGYRRSSANKINFAHLVFNKTEYLKRVRAEIETSANLGQVRIGYYSSYRFKRETIESLISATDYLEQNDMTDDVRAFMTAAIITGYAWNRELFWLEQMRPVNDYDIARFYLQFLTMKTYNITFDKIYSITRSKKDKIIFGNIKLWLPQVNDKQLSIEQAMLAFSQTPLIEHINPDGI